MLNYKATNEKNKKDEINRISMPVQKGNHLHNLEVVRQKRGYLVVARANKVCCFVQGPLITDGRNRKEM